MVFSTRRLAVLVFTPLQLLASGCSDPEAAAPDLAVAARERLEALGYATWAESSDVELARRGVTLHDRSAASRGLNVFCSETRDVAHFVTMEGEIVHSVEHRAEGNPKASNRCKLIELYDEDEVLMLHEALQVTRLGLDSTPRWELRGRYHHDIAVGDGGRIYVPKDVPRRVPGILADRDVRDTDIEVLSPEGRVLRRIPVSAAVVAEPQLLEASRKWARKRPDSPKPPDVHHLNTVEFIDRARELSDGTQIERGDLLLCFRHLDAVAILDPDTGRFRWTWGPGVLDKPHHPRFLPNGNLLIFDNGMERGYSRVIELEPGSRTITWDYRSDPPEAFHSKTRGTAQALPNGNVLVTDSDAGRVFEVTRSGETVWEFWNPDVDAHKNRRATIYRMMRLTPEETAAIAFPGAVRERLRERGYLGDAPATPPVAAGAPGSAFEIR